MLGALLLALRQPLADRLWPQARIDRLLAEGDQALSEGRLDQADGGGARQKYEAAQALDSDRGEARAGLARVGRQALARADAAIAAGRPVEAGRWLALAAELQVPRAQRDAVARRLREVELADVDPAALGKRAAAALAARDPERALPLYARWLAAVPGDAVALEGREDALSLLLERVPVALQAGDLAAAAHWLATARRHDPGHVELPDLQAAYAQALSDQVRDAQRSLARGEADAAGARFVLLRAVAPEDPAVAEGARRTASVLAGDARRLAADFRFEAAGRALDLARRLAPDLAEVAAATRDLERARAAESRLHPATAGGRGGALALRAALAAFEESLAAGDLIEPPGTSAYDRLRAAQAISPQDPRVHAASRRMQAAAAACVEDGLRGNRLRSAQECHDAWRSLAPADRALAPAGARLAQRWLAVGEERLRAGELDAASRALGSARRIDPRTQGLDELERRLSRARAGAP
ncbi:hypothetical protein [Pseudoxanthomonas sp. 10H]|uniref:hypothetical protein n=1 Tax=Pseudoxanthomonas sp. 10H TaxID=3242729 RepID=UPI003557A9C6